MTVITTVDSRPAVFTGAPAHRSALAAWSDDQLADAIGQGHQNALAEVYRRHSRSVARAARRVLKEVTDCEDVVSDVFAAFWQNPASFDPRRGSLAAFLCVKAHGRSIDLVRAEVARRRREQVHFAGGRPPVGGADELLLTSEKAESMQIAIASLSPSERESIALAFFTGLTYADVAVHLGRPEGTVKSQIRRGLQKLRVSLEGEFHKERVTESGTRPRLMSGFVPAAPG